MARLQVTVGFLEYDDGYEENIIDLIPLHPDVIKDVMACDAMIEMLDNNIETIIRLSKEYL